MIINKLTLENVGLFRGEHVFDLKPKVSATCYKPIILIGGKNGAGKTTFFEAVRLCLYGPSFQENQLSRTKYEQYLANKIHHASHSNIQPIEARIEVEFEYSHLGKIDSYVVTRAWKHKGKGIDETLTISRNGKPLDDLEMDQWQEFLNELIPPGISQLFFFDGEKIQQLAEDHENKGHLKDSFKSLLGLDLVERLQADLRIYVTRNSKELGVADIGDKIQEIEGEVEGLDELLDKNYQQRAQLQSFYDKTVGDIERQELKIASEGGTFASKRDNLKSERAKIDAKIEVVDNQIRDMCFNLLPFAITPKYCTMLKDRLIKEEEYQKWKATQEILNSKAKEINSLLHSSAFWDGITIDYVTQEGIINNITKVLNEKLKSSNDYTDFKQVHQLSPIEQQKMLSWIDAVSSTVPDQFQDHINKLEKLNRRRQQVEKSLSSAPDDDILLPLIQKLNELNVELGSLQEKIKDADEEIRKIELERDDCKRKLQTQYEKLKSHDHLSDRLVLADKVQNALKDYTLHLRKDKIKGFSQAFLECFSTLSRKGNFVESIKINEEDFSVDLYGHRGIILKKEELSAGEKQIYAISMLWALTKISGRPLPFIIDTPLGRLDTDHRSSLINDFFPHASHQMIIFSTDTEIDKEYFKNLLPYTARAYHLDYFEEAEMTKVTEGYFWKTEIEGVISEL